MRSYTAHMRFRLRTLSAVEALIICLALAPPLGGLLGWLHLGPRLLRYDSVMAFIVGGVVGLLTCWAPALALPRKPLRIAFLAVYLPSAALSYASTSWAGTWDNALTLGLTVAFFLLCCFIAWALLPNIRSYRRDPHRCVLCRYDLRGLPTRVCPECGADNNSPDALRAPHPGNPYERTCKTGMPPNK